VAFSQCGRRDTYSYHDSMIWRHNSDWLRFLGSPTASVAFESLLVYNIAFHTLRPEFLLRDAMHFYQRHLLGHGCSAALLIKCSGSL